MKLFISIFVFFCSLSLLRASSDEENNPQHLHKEILASLSNELKVIPDLDGNILKQYKMNRFDSDLIPDRIQKWSLVTPYQMLRGDKELVKPFLRESWVEPSGVGCPHHARALSGDERIWFVVISESYRAVSLRSMPIKHLGAVRELLKNNR